MRAIPYPIAGSISSGCIYTSQTVANISAAAGYTLTVNSATATGIYHASMCVHLQHPPLPESLLTTLTPVLAAYVWLSAGVRHAVDLCAAPGSWSQVSAPMWPLTLCQQSLNIFSTCSAARTFCSATLCAQTLQPVASVYVVVMKLGLGGDTKYIWHACCFCAGLVPQALPPSSSSW
jgi:hypothetical protein